METFLTSENESWHPEKGLARITINSLKLMVYYLSAKKLLLGKPIFLTDEEKKVKKCIAHKNKKMVGLHFFTWESSLEEAEKQGVKIPSFLEWRELMDKIHYENYPRVKKGFSENYFEPKNVPQPINVLFNGKIMKEANSFWTGKNTLGICCAISVQKKKTNEVLIFGKEVWKNNFFPVIVK